MLEGRTVNLRVLEKEDLALFAEWINKPKFFGEYMSLMQLSKSETEKMLENERAYEMKDFIIEKKDGGRIGLIFHFYVLHPAGRQLEIGYALVPSERGKGYCTEAIRIMVDYLFLSRDTMRVQACTDTGNLASQKVLEKTGFKREGVSRKNFFTRGRWTDDYLYSILREEWKEPKILTRTDNK
ncbi:MAG: GNAT family protein [Candidatus Bathyarchaeia archaeon]